MENALENVEKRLPIYIFILKKCDGICSHAYFYIEHGDNDRDGVPVGKLRMKSLRKDITMDLVNEGIYPELNITDFEAHYVEKDEEELGGYFDISYKIVSDLYPDREKEVQLCVRVTRKKRIKKETVQ